MLSQGNSDPHVCALNLFKTVRGEVAYVRSKGLASKYIDRPSAQVAPLVIADAKLQLKIFEPRIEIEKYDIKAALDEVGNLNNELDMKEVING